MANNIPICVATYNIYHGEGMDGRFDLPSLAAVIGSAQADIVGLQEVDKCTTRSMGIDQAQTIADYLHYRHAYAAHFPYKGGEYGVAVLSRFPIVRTEHWALPTDANCEQRTLLLATVDIGELVDVYNTHLEVRNRAVREAQCDAVAAIVAQSRRPVILMGDMNAIPGQWDMNGKLHALLWDTDADGNSFTFPSGSPRKRIDYILCSAHWQAQGSQRVVECIDSPCSDHLLVVAKLLLQKA